MTGASSISPTKPMEIILRFCRRDQYLKGSAQRNRLAFGRGLRGARRASSQECTHQENVTLALILKLTIHSTMKNYVTGMQKSPLRGRCGLKLKARFGRRSTALMSGFWEEE